eukprot:g45275.t1
MWRELTATPGWTVDVEAERVKPWVQEAVTACKHLYAVCNDNLKGDFPPISEEEMAWIEHSLAIKEMMVEKYIDEGKLPWEWTHKYAAMVWQRRFVFHDLPRTERTRILNRVQKNGINDNLEFECRKEALWDMYWRESCPAEWIQEFANQLSGEYEQLQRDQKAEAAKLRKELKQRQQELGLHDEVHGQQFED